MKTYIKNLCGLCFLCVLCGVSVSCQDGDWDAPDFSDGVPYGNNAITDDNVITIAQLKTNYPKYAANYTVTKIDSDCKLRVRVTGNDVQGNLYNCIAVQEDATGDAILFSISGSDMFAFMPVGQELLVDLKGLYIGGYSDQPQIGIPYQKDANSDYYVSRMGYARWKQHVKLIGTADPSKVVPIEFNSTRDLAADCGKLMTIKNVSVKGADGKLTWAPKGGDNSVKRYFVESPYSDNKKYMIYTSTYADFANTPIPTGKMNLTGIWKRFGTSWELIIRDTKDIEVIGE